MHISDGVLATPVWMSGYIVSTSVIAITARRMSPRDVPKTAVMTSVFFVGSLIHVPIGPTSVHLLLVGLTGVVLGPLSFAAIFLGLVLQAFLFQHGGITTIGINSIMMGLPALVAYIIFDLRNKFTLRANEAVFGALAGGAAVFFSTLLLAAFLITTGSEFTGVARIAIVAHVPVIIIEAVVAGFAASFIGKVKPDLFERRKR